MERATDLSEITSAKLDPTDVVCQPGLKQERSVTLHNARDAPIRRNPYSRRLDALGKS
jgi:hypothetical protein